MHMYPAGLHFCTTPIPHTSDNMRVNSNIYQVAEYPTEKVVKLWITTIARAIYLIWLIYEWYQRIRAGQSTTPTELTPAIQREFLLNSFGDFILSAFLSLAIGQARFEYLCFIIFLWDDTAFFP